MNNHSDFFVGFPNFEEFLVQSSENRIYLTHYELTRPTGTPGLLQTAVLVAAANFRENVCHYWTWRQGGYNTINNVPTCGREKVSAMLERARAAVRALAEVARDNGFAVVPALVSVPKDLVQLEGSCRCLRYLETANDFERIMPGEPEDVREKLAA